jgi:two-component system, OmpR family, phosphate regulon sensor histidine kinase PhoR
MFLAMFISAIAGLLIGFGSCYIWRETYFRQQLQQVLAVMEMSKDREDISLPLVSQLRRKAIIIQQQQQQLQQQLFSWQSLLEEAPIGYLQIDAEDRVLWCNQVAQQLLQIQKWAPGQARLLLELARSYELDRLIDKSRSSQVATELVWQFHFGYHNSPNSQSIWLKANTIPLADGAIAIFLEDRQDRIDAAHHQERWLGDLAHELRTPLTAIHLMAETLQAKVTSELTRWADRILQETNRSIDLIQHFSELSRLETSSSQNLQLVEVDLVRLIEHVWHTLEPISGQRQIQFVYTGPSAVILEIDTDRFTQVAINLFDNSIKYCPDRGHIWIDIRLVAEDRPNERLQSNQANRVEIDLYDDGSGFSSTDLPHIFERLYRGDISRQRQPKSNSNFTAKTTGSGLGLSIVRQIILAHQGTIVANNHPSTNGAWFHIVLPM